MRVVSRALDCGLNGEYPPQTHAVKNLGMLWNLTQVRASWRKQVTESGPDYSQPLPHRILLPGLLRCVDVPPYDTPAMTSSTPVLLPWTDSMSQNK